MNPNSKIKTLFIDDDRATNFLHKHIARNSDGVDSIRLVHSGIEALNFLEKCLEDSVEKPNLIFLDINMPAMNGWEFLEQFYMLNEDLVKEINVVILSSSDDPGDIERFKQNNKLLDFIRKPLNKEALNSVLAKVG
ncbi:response regulator [Algibacter sp. R77976]|uniref:response regulator n=1 Tax=Algibacter sp. R77976 TaxID=3093873 RepID=UPI0037C80D44